MSCISAYQCNTRLCDNIPFRPRGYSAIHPFRIPGAGNLFLDSLVTSTWTLDVPSNPKHILRVAFRINRIAMFQQEDKVSTVVNMIQGVNGDGEGHPLHGRVLNQVYLKHSTLQEINGGAVICETT